MTPELTPIRVDDAAALFDALDHPDVGTFIGGPVATSPEALAEVIRRWLAGPGIGRSETWVNLVVRLDDGQVVGYVQTTVHDTWAEVAWVLGTPWWGRGVGTQAARSLVELVDTRFGPRELWATIHPENIRSERLLLGLGFVETTRDVAPELGSYDPGDRVFTRPRP